MTIVGIAPREFYGDRLTDNPPQFYIPMRSLQTLTPTPFLDRTDIGWLYLIGRVKPGVARPALQAELTEHPEAGRSRMRKIIAIPKSRAKPHWRKLTSY